MKLLLCTFLCAASCLAFLGCSDPSSSPNIPSGDTNFIVKSLDADSLYFGESGRIRGRGFGNDTATLKLFVGSVPLSIKAVNDSTLDFIVSENASDGMFRLYRNDTLAGGKVSISITQRAFNANSLVLAVSPSSGYEREKLKIFGTEMIFRRRDTRLMFGSVEAHIDSVSKAYVYTTVPVGVQNRSISIETPWQTIGAGSFTRLERPSPAIFNSTFHGLAIGLRLRVVQDVLQLKDSARGTRIIELSNSYSYEQTTGSIVLSKKDDSLLYAGMSLGEAGDTTWIDLRLKLDTEACSLTGTLRFIKSQFSFGQGLLVQELLLRLEQTVYRNYADHIDLIATQFENPAGISIEEYTITQWNGDASNVATIRDPIRLDDLSGTQIDPMIQLRLLYE
jgi:hypothetical protein